MRSVRVRACVRLHTRVFLRALLFHFFCLRVRAQHARAHGYSGRAEDGGKFGSCASARKTLSMTGCVPYPPLSGVAGTPARACGHSFRVLLSREGVLQRRPCRPRRSALLGLRLRSVGCLCLRAVPAAAHAAQGCPVVWLFVCAVVATLRCTGHSLCCRAGAPPSGSVGVGRAVPQALTYQYSIDRSANAVNSSRQCAQR
jgi:hypothetical protein